MGRRQPSPVTVTVMPVILALVLNLATNTVQVPWRWWPVLVWFVAVGLTAMVVLLEVRRHHAEPTPFRSGSGAPGEIESDPATRVKKFCGRKREIDEIAARLRRRRRPADTAVRVIVLDGLAGSGKTTLMDEVAERHRDEFERVVRIELNGSSDEPMPPAELLRRLTRGLDIDSSELDDEARYRKYRQVVDYRRVLILLDDAVDADQIRQVATFNGDSVVMITSRVELIGLPASTRIDVRSFATREALDLLSAEVGADRVAAAPKAAASIVSRCGYLPLAIHLVSSRIDGPSRSMADLAELDADLAAAGLSAIAERPTAATSARTMRKIFDGVYRRLEPKLGRLFLLMGEGPRDVDAEMAGALMGVPEREALELLRDLHAHRLVEPVGTRRAGSGPVRYRLHDLLREFAREVAAGDPAEVAAAARRLSALRLRQVEKLIDRAAYGPAREIGLAGAAEAHRAFQNEDHATCWRLVARLAQLYEVIGFPEDWSKLHERGSAAAQAVDDDEARIAVLLADGTRLSYRWQWDELLDLLAEAENMSGATDASNARVSTMRSHAYAAIGEPDRALSQARRALSYDVDDRSARCRALVALGEAHRVSGALVESAAQLRKAVVVAETLPVERSRALRALATPLAELGHVEEAMAALTEAATIDADTANQWHLFAVLVQTADLRRRRRDGQAATLAVLEEAMGLHAKVDFHRQRDGGQTADALLTVAECHLALGQLSEAGMAWQQADALQITALETRRLVVRGALALAEGRVVEAVRALDPTVTNQPARTVDQVRLHARAAALLGDAYGCLEDYARAAEYHAYADRLTGEETGRAERARAAATGSPLARARLRSQVTWRWPTWSMTVLAFLVCLPTIGLTAHDGNGVRVGPADGFSILAACALGVVVATRLRPYGAGILLGYLSAPPVALGVILLTSGQVRTRGDLGMLVGYAVCVAAIVVIVARRSRPVPWLSLVSLSIVGPVVVATLPALESRPVQPWVWDGVGATLIVVGMAWLPIAALRHPTAYRQVNLLALAAAPIAGGGLALLLGAGLGRQTYLLWPGHTGSDWLLALLGLSTAAACVSAAFIGPARLSSGVLGGLAWFWGIHGALLGMAHSESNPPNGWLHPIQYWHWLTSASIWVWVMPLLCLLVVGVLAIASSLTEETAPVRYDAVSLRPPLPDPQWLARRVATARWVRVRIHVARALLIIVVLSVGGFLDTLGTPEEPENATQGIVLWTVICLGLAALAHPDLSWKGHRRNGLRWLGAAVLIGFAVVVAIGNVRNIAAHGWSRGAFAGLAVAVAAVFATGVVAPYRTVLNGRTPIDRDRLAGACIWAASLSVIAAGLVGAASVTEFAVIVLGMAVGAGVSYLYPYLRRRRRGSR